MPTIKVSGGEIFYEVKGKGEPLVLLRGLGRSSRYWLGFDECMAESFRVVTIDHRGVGRSTVDFFWHNSIEDLAHDVELVLNQVGINSAHIFGLSLGGMVAMALAAESPDRCRSLMVANSSSADYLQFRINPLSIAKLGISTFGGKLHESLKLSVTTDKIDRRIGHLVGQEWDDIRDEEGFPMETILKQIKAALNFHIKGRLDGRVVPTLILYGNQDHFVPKANSKRLHKLIPYSELRLVRGVGHEISIGREDQLRELILRFTNQSKSRAS